MFCNLAAFDRFDPANHDAARFVEQDMNRQWSDERMDAADSRWRRRRAALRPFVAQADWLLDLHSMHEPQRRCCSPACSRATLALSKMAAPEHIVIDAGHQDGVRMRDYGRFGLPDAQAGDSRSLLVECGFHGDPPAAPWRKTNACASSRRRARRWRRAGAFAARLAPDRCAAPMGAAGHRPGGRQERGAYLHRSLHRPRGDRPAGTVIGDNDGEPVTTPTTTACWSCPAHARRAPA